MWPYNEYNDLGREIRYKTYKEEQIQRLFNKYSFVLTDQDSN